MEKVFTQAPTVSTVVRYRVRSEMHLRVDVEEAKTELLLASDDRVELSEDSLDQLRESSIEFLNDVT